MVGVPGFPNRLAAFLMDCFQHPMRMRRDAKLVVIDENTGICRSPERDRYLENSTCITLLQNLQDYSTADDLVRRLSLQLPSMEVIQSLLLLQQDGWLEFRLPTRGRPEIRNLSQNPIEASLEELWRSWPVSTHQSSWTLVVVDDPLHFELEDWDKLGDWVLFSPSPTRAWLGPWFSAGRTAPCLHCLHSAMASTRPLYQLFPVTGSRLSMKELTEQCSWATQILQQTSPSNEILTRSDGETRRHPVRPRSTCTRCGSPATHPEPPQLQTSDRLSQEQQWEMLQTRVGPITGISPALQEIAGAPVFLQVAPYFPKRVRRLEDFQAMLGNTAGGKGSTRLASQLSAVGEACERFSAQWQGDEFRQTSSFHQLGEAAISPDLLQLYSPLQQRNPCFHSNWRKRVPWPFDPHRQLDWSPAWSLTRQQWRWVPSAWAYLGHPQARGEGSLFLGQSNGHAAGSSLAQAVLNGFFELVERDAVAQWWFNRLGRPAADLSGLDSSWFHLFGDKMTRLGLSFWVLDLTSDLEIPVCVAIATAGTQCLMGYGCHWSKTRAAQRALTELCQSMPRYQKQAPRHDRQSPPPRPESSERHYLYPDPGAASTARDWLFKDTAEELVCAQAIVEGAGLELLIMDQTRSEVGVPVVKVIAPGLRLHWRALAPGRLYQVPYQLGRLTRPLAEEELNRHDISV